MVALAMTKAEELATLKYTLDLRREGKPGADPPILRGGGALLRSLLGFRVPGDQSEPGLYGRAVRGRALDG